MYKKKVLLHSLGVPLEFHELSADAHLRFFCSYGQAAAFAVNAALVAGDWQQIYNRRSKMS